MLPLERHGHLHCRQCGSQAELAADDAAVAAAVTAFDVVLGFEIDLTHLSLIGRCAACRATDARAGGV